MTHFTRYLEGNIIQGEEYFLQNVGNMFCEQFIKFTRSTCFVRGHDDFRTIVCSAVNKAESQLILLKLHNLSGLLLSQSE